MAQYDFLFVKPSDDAMPYTRHDCLRRYPRECGANNCVLSATDTLMIIVALESDNGTHRMNEL